MAKGGWDFVLDAYQGVAAVDKNPAPAQQFMRLFPETEAGKTARAAIAARVHGQSGPGERYEALWKAIAR